MICALHDKVAFLAKIHALWGESITVLHEILQLVIFRKKIVHHKIFIFDNFDEVIYSVAFYI